MLYAFILGKNYHLSQSEILSLLSRLKITYDVKEYTDGVLILDTTMPLDVPAIMALLGGTIKIVRIVKKIAKFSQKTMVPLLLSYLIEGQDVNGKLHIGFSLYLANNRLTSQYASQFQKRIYKLGMSTKSELKNQGYSARLVVSRDPTLSSVVVKKNKLLTSGKEFVILPITEKTFYLGVTEAVQDFEKYSQLDYGRPGRDDKSGMLPPKLAQMMLNLAQAPLDGVVVDPFCGSGTLITQALLSGYQHLIGSDVSPRAVGDAHMNIEWIAKEDNISLTSDITVFQADVKNISKRIKAESVDAIVAEPYMGEGVTHAQVHDKKYLASRVQTMKGLEQLFITAFREFKTILKPGGRVVMIFPAFQVNKSTTIYAEVLDQICGLGFDLLTPFDDVIEYSDRGSIIYAREGQHVMREIFVWERKNI